MLLSCAWTATVADEQRTVVAGRHEPDKSGNLAVGAAH
jgi:hypothetical protein